MRPPRPARLRPKDIGAEIVAARQAGMRWKLLKARYGLSRSRLFQIWQKAQDRTVMRPCCPSCLRPYETGKEG